MVDVAETRPAVGDTPDVADVYDNFIRRLQIRVIQDVEELRAKLQAETLGEMCIACGREVELRQIPALSTHRVRHCHKFRWQVAEMPLR